jgi:deoxycytidine triphosphate deaminase
MTLPSSTIRQLIETNGAISPVSEERLNTIEGNAFDLTVDEIMLIRGRTRPQRYETTINKPEVFFGRQKRRVPIQHQITWKPNIDEEYVIECEPGVPYLFKTIETVTLPEGVEAEVIPRSSIFRAGGIVVGTWVPHGFTGNLFVHFSIPSGGHAMTFERGARFAALKFHALAPGIGTPYDGIWTGDKSCTDGEERAF